MKSFMKLGPIRTLAILFCLFDAGSAHANVGEAFGFGARSISLGGASVAGAYDGYAAYSNPAALPFEGEKRLRLSYGLLYMNPTFTPIAGVVVENSYVSDKENAEIGDVDTSYRSIVGQQMGLSLRLIPSFFNFTLGAVLYIPLQQMIYIDTGAPFAPEYPMYRSRPQRPQVELGAGGDLGAGFKFGVGVHIAFALTADAIVFLQSDANKPSTMRFSASMKPKAAPYFGFYYAPGSTESEPGLLSLGAVVRLPVASQNEMVLNSSARIIGGFIAPDFNFLANSTLFYDPLTVELGATLKHLGNNRLYAQLDFQRWSSYQSPTLQVLDPKISGCGSSGCGVNVSPGNNPPVQYVNIIIPRVGEEVTIGPVSLRAGYGYRPSFIKDLPTGAGNTLDPPKHMINIGFGYRFQSLFSLQTPWTLDFYGTYHKLVTQKIVKTSGDESGAGTGDLKIGAPGYDAGGKVLGAGVSLSLAL